MESGKSEAEEIVGGGGRMGFVRVDGVALPAEISYEQRQAGQVQVARLFGSDEFREVQVVVRRDDIAMCLYRCQVCGHEQAIRGVSPVEDCRKCGEAGKAVCARGYTVKEANEYIRRQNEARMKAWFDRERKVG